MTSWEFVRFIHRFAGRDLLRGGAWRATVVNVGSTALVTAVTFTAIGLALGASERKRVEMQERGLPPLFCGNPNVKDILTTSLCTKLEQALVDNEKLGKGAAQIYPFHVQEWSWVTAKNVVPMTGRTLVDGDPIRKRVKLLRGVWFRNASAPGFVVTEQFLKNVGKEGAELPLKLEVELRNSEKLVTIIGVVDHLFLAHDFLLTETYFLELDRWDWEGSSPWADSGPVGPDWPGDDKLSENLRKALDDDDVNGPVVIQAADGKPTVWNLEARDEKDRQRRFWVNHFKALRDGLNRKDDRSFADADQIRLKPRAVKYKPPEDWNTIGIYADTLEHLEAAKGVATSKPFFLPEQKDKIYDLKNFDSVSNKALWGSLVAGFVLLLNSCANLMVIQQLRAALKVAEIGMLKAMGMGAGLLQCVFLHEGLLIWAAGTLIGMPAGYGLGMLVSAVGLFEESRQTIQASESTGAATSPAALLSEETVRASESTRAATSPTAVLSDLSGPAMGAFYCPWYLWLIPLALAPFFLFSTWFGTRRARRLPPIRTLRPS